MLCPCISAARASEMKGSRTTRGGQQFPNAPLRANSSYVPATDPSSDSEHHFSNWISITFVTPLAKAGTPSDIKPSIWKPLSYRIAKAVELICVRCQLWPWLLLLLTGITFPIIAVISTFFPKAVLEKEREGEKWARMSLLTSAFLRQKS